jgi:hypothetical protein
MGWWHPRGLINELIGRTTLSNSSVVRQYMDRSSLRTLSHQSVPVKICFSSVILLFDEVRDHGIITVT